MHELSIARSVVAIVAEKAEGRKVFRVTLQIGALSAVLPDAVRFCFDVAAEGTVVEGAELDIEIVEGLGRCRSCGAELPLAGLIAACTCGSRHIERVRGEELKIKQMETEAA